MRELHAVFAVLKTLGKITYGSSLDKSFIETRIYGPNTVTQIKVIVSISNILLDLVPFVQFKKHEKNTHGGVLLLVKLQAKSM